MNLIVKCYHLFNLKVANTILLPSKHWYLFQDAYQKDTFYSSCKGIIQLITGTYIRNHNSVTLILQMKKDNQKDIYFSYFCCYTLCFFFSDSYLCLFHWWSRCLLPNGSMLHAVSVSLFLLRIEHQGLYCKCSLRCIKLNNHDFNVSPGKSSMINRSL